jgi:soluble P-type ATPase
MIFTIPNGETFEINTIVFDLNGTLSVNGKIKKTTVSRLKKLKKLGCKLIVFTGDIRSNAEELCGSIGVDFMITKTGTDKEREMKKLDKGTCAAIGNARIDIPMFDNARISVITLQAEGIHKDIISHADIITTSIDDALDLFINAESLCATMRE